MFPAYCRARRLIYRLERHLSPRGARQARIFATLKERFYKQFWHQAADAIGARLEDVGQGYLRISRGAKSTFVRYGEVMLDDHLTYMMAGDKPLIYRLLQQQMVPLPRFCEFNPGSLDRGLAHIRGSTGPVVVKPASGTAAGRGITTGVSNAREFRHASMLASMHSSRLLVEDEVDGESYRLLFLDGVLLDAVRRDRPIVIGDGRHSIRELIASENDRRANGPSITSLHPITLDYDLKLRLQKDRRRLSDIPAKKERVVVKNVCNQNSCREQHVVRENIHPSTLNLAKDIVRKLDIELAGVDIHCANIAAPLSSNGGKVGEVNTTPGLHHHVLVSDRSNSIPVGEIVLEHVLERANES